MDRVALLALARRGGLLARLARGTAHQAPVALRVGQAVTIAAAVACVVEDDRPVFPRRGAERSADLLKIESQRLRRAQQDRGLDARDVVALGDQVGGGEHQNIARGEACHRATDQAPLHLPVHRRGGNAGGLEAGGHVGRVLNRTAEGNRALARRQLIIVCDGIARDRRAVHCIGQFANGEVASSAADALEIREGGRRIDLGRREIALVDQVGGAGADDHVVEGFVQPAPVQPLRCRRHAEHPSLRIGRHDLRPGRAADQMMCLVGHDQVGGFEMLKAVGEGEDAGNDDRRAREAVASPDQQAVRHSIHL